MKKILYLLVVVMLLAPMLGQVNSVSALTPRQVIPTTDPPQFNGCNLVNHSNYPMIDYYQNLTDCHARADPIITPPSDQPNGPF